MLPTALPPSEFDIILKPKDRGEGINLHYRKRLNFRGPKTHENKPKPTKI
jgi:hypothetical protein